MTPEESRKYLQKSIFHFSRPPTTRDNTPGRRQARAGKGRRRKGERKGQSRDTKGWGERRREEGVSRGTTKLNDK
jgi:hypothetical protein